MNKTLLTLSLLLGLAAVGKASETAVYIYDGKEYSAKERQALLVLVHQGNLSSRTVDTGTMYTNSDGIDLVCLNSSEGIFLVPTTITPDNDLSISLTSSTQSWTNLKYPNLSGVTKIHLRFRVAVNAQNFPDENFRSWVLSQDYGSDAVLTKEEIASVTEINVGEKSISNLKGIEYFTALTELVCNNNQLTSLDVSKNTKLTELACSNNPLTSLDVSKNTALTSLDCTGNKLTSLDLSKNTALTELYCNRNQLTSLDLSKNTALTYLYCISNQLTSLDLSKNTALTYLDCGFNQLTSLDLSKNTALTTLYCYENQLTSLDVSRNTALTNLRCYTNQLTSLDVLNNKALTTLYCYNNQIHGAGMAKLIETLPTVESGSFYVYNTDGTDGNRITTVQVAAAKGKGWSVLTSTGSDYAGVDPGIAIDATNFPDGNFRAYVSSNTIDQDGDGFLSTEEIAGVTKIDVSRKSIASLKGIEYFTALTWLNCIDNQLTSLDVSRNTALTVLGCYNNQLTSLDVSKNTALTTLGCEDNELTTLDVSKNTALRFLSCSSNQLTSLDMSKNTALEELYCGGNKLTSLDVSKNTTLTSLSCGGNKLTSLDVSNNKALTTLYCYNNQIHGAGMATLVNNLPTVTSGSFYVYNTDGTDGNRITTVQVAAAKAKGWKVKTSSGGDYAGVDPGIAIDETNFPDDKFREWVLGQEYGADGILTDEEIAGVTSFNVSGKSITNLKGIEYFTALKWLHCYNNQLTSLDVSKNTALTYLDCYDNQLTSLDVSGCTALRYLSCYGNQLTSLDVSKNTALTYLYCNDNQLTSLDVSNNTALIDLLCNNNKLTSLDVSNNTALTDLRCNNNKLTSLDVSNNTALTGLVCYSNQLTSLDVSKNTALTELWCANNQLTSLDVSKNTALTKLVCYNNKLTSLDVSKNTALTLLECYLNQLTSLDVSNNTALTYLYCYSNRLTALDMTKNTKLISLYCHANQLTSLDVSGCTALTELKCNGNLIRGAAMTALVNSLPDRSATSWGSLYVYDDETPMGNMMTEVQVAAAKAKKWWPTQRVDGEWIKYDGEVLDAGDANGDGEVNATDVATVRDYILGLDPQPFSLKSADLNYDEVVDIVDLTLLIEMMK